MYWKKHACVLPCTLQLTRFQAYTLTNALDGQDGVPWFDYTQILEPGVSSIAYTHMHSLTYLRTSYE